VSKFLAPIDLPGKIKKSWQQRSPLRERCSAFRAINGEADGLPGLFVDVINKTGIVSSTSEWIDKNTDRITDMLVSQGDLETVWIKNDTEQRKRNGLILSSYIAHGPSPAPEVIITENDQTYFWYSAQKIFAIAQRPLRLWFPEMKTPGLILGFAESDIVSVVHKNDPIPFAVTIPSEENLTPYCQDVRVLKENHSYKTIIVNHPGYTPSPKNKTALFHFYFHLFDLVDPGGFIFLSCPFWHKVKNTFDHVAKRKKRPYQIVATAPSEPDFKAARHGGEITFLTIKI
jgi:23S rRNA G2069 N7-methylase RlmK/C1962 C5-methylase RlmI